jgi:aryl-alcohol dehydrogenase-like predicted oxidoreductase
MQNVKFADTEDSVSEMALGCLAFGTKVGKELSYQFLDSFFERGGNFLDSANNYSFWDADGKGGESERLLGEWMARRGNRDKVFLATKLGAFPTVSRDEFLSYKGNPWADLTEGLSRKSVLSAVDSSLARLGTDHIDLLYAHVDDRRVDQEETLEALNEVVKAGKARYIGCSNFKVWRLARAREISRARGWAPYRAYQGFCTYFQTEKGANTGMNDQMGGELFDYADTTGDLSLVAYTPLLWGSYTQPKKYDEIPALRHFKRPQNAERGARLEKVAKERGWTVNQVIYRWMMQLSPRIIPLVAATSAKHLEEDLTAAELRLSEAEVEFLNRPTEG